MITQTVKSIGAITAAVFATAAFLAPTTASAVDFSGKTITAIIPAKEGGGGDVFTRLFAPFFSQYLPGKPTVIVRNMPGGAHIRGNNWFEANAKRNGLNYITVSTSGQTSFTLGGKKVKYDLTKWKYVIAIPHGTVIYARPETGVKGKNIGDDIAALRKAQIVTGAKSPISSELRLFLGMELLGIKSVKPVFGLSTGEQRKGMLRGELNINYDSAAAYAKKVIRHVEKGKLVAVMTLGYTDKNGNIVRDPGYPKLPTIVDAYKAVNGGKLPSGDLWKAYKNFYTMGVMTSKGVALPPDTPKDVVDAYITAAQKIAEDEKFQKIAGKRLGNYPILFGTDAGKTFSDAVDISPEVKAFMTKFINKKFDTNI
ncbi:MAG: hypothetical protein RIB59_09410 [Rhodospirillales bacterium]